MSNLSEFQERTVMALNKRDIPAVVITSALVSMAANLPAEESPFQAEVFYSKSYQIADLDEEGCGGELTEYRRAPKEGVKPENETEEKDEAAVPEVGSEPNDGKDLGIIEKIKSFFSGLFG